MSELLAEEREDIVETLRDPGHVVHSMPGVSSDIALLRFSGSESARTAGALIDAS